VPAVATHPDYFQLPIDLAKKFVQGSGEVKLRWAIEEDDGWRIYQDGEHRVVMAQHLKRPLLTNEAVFNVDGDKGNNHVSNLSIKLRRFRGGKTILCATDPKRWNTNIDGLDRKIDKEGYAWVYVDDCGWQQEHRLVLAQKLGRPLVPIIETVHHINGVRDDNDPDNLELWLGGVRYGQRASDIVCPHCHMPYMG
jgi:hypothetical protein